MKIAYLRRHKLSLRRSACRFAMNDPFDLRKDGHLLARMSGGMPAGEFTAYERMEVSPAGRAYGYVDLQRGQVVNTPHAVQRDLERVQLPLRQGFVHSILVGSSATGKKKKVSTQSNVLVLSYVEKKSHFADHIIDPRGLYDLKWGNTKENYKRFDSKCFFADGEQVRQPDGTNVEQPPPSDNFTFVITSPKYTTPESFVAYFPPKAVPKEWRATVEYPNDEREYTYTLNFETARAPEGTKFIDVGGSYDGYSLKNDHNGVFKLMVDAFSTYCVPAVVTAKGQAQRSWKVARNSSKKRARGASSRAESVASDSEGEGEEEEEESDGEESEYSG